MRFITASRISLGVCLAAGVALATGATAQQAQDPAAPSAQGDVSVTIYNNNLAMVQDVRNLSIGSGRQRIEFPDVSAQIRPQTVSFGAANTTILEQNFDFSLLSPQALMQAAVGQRLTLVRTNPATGQETREQATVLAANGGVVLRIGERIEVLRDDGLPVRVIFDSIPPGLRARPTLSVTVNSERSGTRPAALRYLTSGLGWRSDYVAMFDETAGTIDVQGWITLTNNSGTTYTNAATTLVAGDPGGSIGAFGARSRNVVTTGTETADRDRLGDFYLYPLAGRTTIASNQTKQVSFLDVQRIPATRVYSADVYGFNNDEEARSVNTAISFSSSRNGGLGDALPAGTVRFYQRDTRGTLQFVGENTIAHTPMGSVLSLTTGTAFDVKVQATLVDRQRGTDAQWRTTQRTVVRIPGQPDASAETRTLQERPYWRTTMRYRLTNASPTPVTVDLTQSRLDWWWDSTRVESESLPGVSDRRDIRRWTVEVPANGSRDVNVVYMTRY